MKKIGKRILSLLVLCCLCLAGAAAHADTEDANAVDLYLPADPDTGSWEYTLENEDLVQVESEYYPDIRELGLTGNAGADWFRVSGLEPGTTALRFLYINAATLRTDMTLVYRLTVDEGLNVLIWGVEMLEAEKGPRGEITSFFFTTGGYERPRSYSLRKDEDGQWLAETDSDGEREAPEEMQEELAAIAEEYGVTAWDGFDGAGEGVLDGEDFLFTMVWENGYSVQATGNNVFPENYYDFREAVEELFSGGE